MSFKYLNNANLDTALNEYIGIIMNYLELKHEEISVEDSNGRVTYSPVFAKISSPNFLCSAMDGIMIKAETTFSCSEKNPVILVPSMYKRIDTGDPIDREFDCVVMIEDVIQTENGVKLLSPAVPWQNIRQIGEDLSQGEMVVPSNTVIDPATIGALISTGNTRISVYKKPTLTIIPTGDEVVSIHEGISGEGKVIESNSAVFSAMLKNMGCDVSVTNIIPDNHNLLENTIKEASHKSDVVIVNAGSSAGRDDNTSEVINKLGKVLFHGLAIKPGKPTIMGIVHNKPVIGVPGYPVSGMIVIDNIVRKIVALYTKLPETKKNSIEAIMTRRQMSSLKYREFVRVSLGYMNGNYYAYPILGGAGVISSMIKADGILDISQNSEGIEMGEKVNISLLKDPNEIRNKIIILGSHDPLVDHVIDILKKHEAIPCTSTHLGSLAGIRAIEKGEAHVAGIHLLDIETGEYNIPWVRRYIGDKKTVLVNVVNRLQGLMIKKGNPLTINSLSDIAKKTNINYVNRQKNSGTRVLLDYLLKKEGLHFKDIHGYEREEYTHLAIAASIEAGSADVGLGIYSAAKIYGLDFIPLVEEQYDFLVSFDFFETSNFTKIINILKSNEFAEQTTKLGGYSLENTGRYQVL